jgi:NAD(P)-dependent dehydrogenase (short-subunit alcohol dehydrogenase family)
VDKLKAPSLPEKGAQPLGHRWVRGRNIGCAVRFLLSADARYITGQTLVVDGGAALLGPATEPG